MPLVNYSDSDDETSSAPHSSKRRKTSESEGQEHPTALPPLPTAFRDLYSSTVRTSTKDDPSLHGGRRRVTPHVDGNWPSHVYLEWFPQKDEFALLMDMVKHVRQYCEIKSKQSKNEVHSLLLNDLGVQLPLHVSLSRPLALKTEQKDIFAGRLQTAVSSSGVLAFSVTPLNIIWHANEDHTRWFLVVRLQRPPGDELRKLLTSSNDLTSEYGQPLLYQTDKHSQEQTGKDLKSRPHDSFHISIAWSLRPHEVEEHKNADSLQQPVSEELQRKLGQLIIRFSEVKVRIGQDVTSMRLSERRIEQTVK